MKGGKRGMPPNRGEPDIIAPTVVTVGDSAVVEFEGYPKDTPIFIIIHPPGGGSSSALRRTNLNGEVSMTVSYSSPGLYGYETAHWIRQRGGSWIATRFDDLTQAVEP